MKLLLIDKRQCPTVTEQIAAGFTQNGLQITNKDIKAMGGIDGLHKFLAENEDIYCVFDINKQRFWSDYLNL